jgi:hypothetical protein
VNSLVTRTWNMTSKYGKNKVKTENIDCMRIFMYAAMVMVLVHQPPPWQNRNGNVAASKVNGASLVAIAGLGMSGSCCPSLPTNRRSSASESRSMVLPAR